MLKMNSLNLPSILGCVFVGDAVGKLDGAMVGLIKAEQNIDGQLDGSILLVGWADGLKDGLSEMDGEWDGWNDFEGETDGWNKLDGLMDGFNELVVTIDGALNGSGEMVG